MSKYFDFEAYYDSEAPGDPDHPMVSSETVGPSSAAAGAQAAMQNKTEGGETALGVAHAATEVLNLPRRQLYKNPGVNGIFVSCLLVAGLHVSTC